MSSLRAGPPSSSPFVLLDDGKDVDRALRHPPIAINLVLPSAPVPALPLALLDPIYERHARSRRGDFEAPPPSSERVVREARAVGRAGGMSFASRFGPVSSVPVRASRRRAFRANRSTFRVDFEGRTRGRGRSEEAVFEEGEGEEDALEAGAFAGEEVGGVEGRAGGERVRGGEGGEEDGEVRKDGGREAALVDLDAGDERRTVRGEVIEEPVQLASSG